MLSGYLNINTINQYLYTKYGYLNKKQYINELLKDEILYKCENDVKLNSSNQIDVILQCYELYLSLYNTNLILEYNSELTNDKDILPYNKYLIKIKDLNNLSNKDKIFKIKDYSLYAYENNKYINVEVLMKYEKLNLIQDIVSTYLKKNNLDIQKITDIKKTTQELLKDDIILKYLNVPELFKDYTECYNDYIKKLN